MSLETSRHGFQPEIWRARMVQPAELVVFSNHSRRHYADGRFVPARLAAVWRLARGPAFRHRLSGDGCGSRDARLHPGTRIRFARVADSSDAADLPTDAELRHM